ncbi:hypothetical protein K9N68_05585 [Kovacikia minuta CCNUW1]|uniref:hypothetical protein n=1 Tax=Kovacikia minuta TaxID=2931930 RepID=UPI001CCD204C|nr:hypothetical protein [Kovacikia minuta]UBF27420.1 hypothetical protein K9N68_05585 [Kovacikia minuta CCNUW1]
MDGAIAPNSGFPRLGDKETGRPGGRETNAWYLGIDVGSTGISAVLLNPMTAQLHPIRWSDMGQASAASSYRLPTVAFLTSEQLAKPPEAPAAVRRSRLASAGQCCRTADRNTTGITVE